jgi:hypothetical protein
VVAYVIIYLELGSTISLASWALIPQLVCTGLLLKVYLSWSDIFKLTNVIYLTFISWTLCFGLNLLGYFIPTDGTWPIWKCVLNSFGIPFGDSANNLSTLKSLFFAYNDAQSRLLKEITFTFDGGVAFSWLVFNVSFIAVLILVAKLVSKLWNKSGEIITSKFCFSCGRALISNVRFCPDCGTPIQLNN